MLRVTLLSAILAVATAGSAPEAMIERFIASASPIDSDRGLGQAVTQPEVQTSIAPFATAPSSTVSGSTVVRQASDGLFYVDARVNGERVHFVIDTGASLVVLNASDAARTGVGASSSHVHVETAAGASSMQRARIEDMSVAGQSMKGVDAVIMRDNLKVSLLGQSALAQLDSVSFKGSRLKLN
jgi:aspartyl protease family protein